MNMICHKNQFYFTTRFITTNSITKCFCCIIRRAICRRTLFAIYVHNFHCEATHKPSPQISQQQIQAITEVLPNTCIYNSSDRPCVHPTNELDLFLSKLLSQYLFAITEVTAQRFATLG